ncbi:pyridoxal phosphate-dependent aminotransferase [Mumia sp. zg.B17]|uniref:pyridoxal phosphate-dependent aminotransferase n=1 Tax=unclassified Mumia TaxID=2621872 RepID=UPI001C6DFC2A|nr:MULTISPECIES: pyridoxal phosphate-dependent aminotransferase [unclassified Mumia]MBW9207344.1 pyridoxal phosphate-dependent aminotransferase [Mumia sp. zg.B17]MBW9210308.1 pyridoxal phosphate-dependent aminotransferase [Mumia sp. zg.B21]MDD9349114.1 pyridoxal phosphate-dependent aminotransferase [Mumia sp.]
MKTSSMRVAGLGTTIFAEMSALAVRTGAVNLGQGFPDTDGPQDVIDVAVEAMRSGANQYAPGIGVPALRQAVADHQHRWYGIELDPNTEVAATTGATEAIAAAILGLVDPGDEVVVLEPYYDSYVAVLEFAGGVRRPVTLRAPDFRLDLDALRAAVGPRTTMMLINSPHNPTGMVLNPEEREAIRDLAVEHDLVVVTDEVYEHLVFDGHAHVPLATLPGMRERTLTISSGGKSFSFTGWKVGWLSGPPELVRAAVGAKQFLTYTSGAPLQPAIAHALGHDAAYFEGFAATLQARRDQLCAGLDEVGFTTYVPEGTYFATTDIRPLGYEDGIEFCRALPEIAGVVAVPTQVFYDDEDAGRPLVRWAFCKQEPVIAEALRRLRVVSGSRQ